MVAEKTCNIASEEVLFSAFCAKQSSIIDQVRVGIIINSSWNIFNFRKGLILALLAEGHQVFAIAPDDGAVAELVRMGCVYLPVSMSRKGANPVADSRLILDLYSIYKQQKLNIALHFTIKPNIYGTLAAKLAGIPSINNVTGLGTVFIRETITSRIAQNLYKVAFKFPELVYFQNQDDLNIFLEKGLIKVEKTDLLPGSGIDVDTFLPGEFSESNVFTFLLVGRLLQDKGIAEFVMAARMLKARGFEIKCQLLGAIEETNGLGFSLAQVKEWEAEGIVEYLGRVTDVRPILKVADCVVLPSYREGTPRSLLEAACLGKPLLATDVPGCREVVKHHYNGLLCKVKDANDLALKMAEICQLPAKERKEMGKNSRRLALTKFDQTIVIAKYLSAIKAKSKV